MAIGFMGFFHHFQVSCGLADLDHRIAAALRQAEDGPAHGQSE
jgi:hypothetical protein